MYRRLFLLSGPPLVLLAAVGLGWWGRKPAKEGPESALYARLARHGVVRVTPAGYGVCQECRGKEADPSGGQASRRGRNRRFCGQGE